MKRSTFLIITTITPAYSLFEENELQVPVELYNDNLKNPAAPYPPRYVVGSLGISHLLHHLFTFDTGNSRDSILTTSSCLGCENMINGTSIGCPSTAPNCSEHGGVCWESDPGQPLPIWSYTFVDTPNEYCFNASGYLMIDGQNVSTCMECFGGQSHSRFISMAKFHPDILIYFLNDGKTIHPALPSSFQFGALVRTVPLADRIWSNIGIGYNSSFLVQMTIKRILLRLSPQEKKEIIFYPSKDRYWNVATSSDVDFTVDSYNKRLFHFSYVKIAQHVFWIDVGGNHTVHLDTVRNDGIYISEPLLQDYLANITGGFWFKDEELLNAQQQQVNHERERLYIPKHYDAKPLCIALGNTLHGYSVQVAISKWTFPGKKKSSYLPTIFGKYDHTVLGLPYLAAIGTEYLLDDENHIMHIIGGEMVWNEEQTTELFYIG